MTSSTTDHRATGRGRTHLRCIESSHNDIINIVTGMVDHRATRRGRTHLSSIESSHNDIIQQQITELQEEVGHILDV